MAFFNNQTNDQTVNAMQMLLDQVKTLQEQVTQLTSKQPSPEVPVQPMPNNSQMDLKAMMNARLQGIAGVPAYGSSGISGQGMLQAMGGSGGMNGGLSGQGMLQAMGGSGGMNGELEGGCCVWVSGIPEEFRKPQMLCNIFGCYGNVMRIRFSRKKPDGALIEFQEPQYAQNAFANLNGVKFPDGRVRVVISKIANMTMNQGEDSDLGKDFSRGMQFRYRDYNSKFTQTCMRRLSRPTSKVMVSNIPEDKLSEVKEYFIESGFTVDDFQEGKKKETEGGADRKFTYAIVSFSSSEEAIEAVGKLHNDTKFHQGRRGLQLSFAGDLEKRPFERRE